MNKTKIYYKNGKAFFKAGGRFYPLPEMQGGGGSAGLGAGQAAGSATTNSNLGSFIKSNPQLITGISGLVSGLVSNYDGSRQTDQNPDPLVQNYMKGYKNDRFSSSANTLLDTASSLDPTGTAAIVNGVIKLGQGADNGLSRRDEYGIAKSDTIGDKMLTSLGELLNPIGSIQRRINVGKKHGWKTALTKNPNEVMQDDLDKAKYRADYRDMSQRQGTNTGNYRNDSIYAKRGVNLSSTPMSNQGKPNVEIEDGEIYIGSPGAVTKFGNTSTSLNSQFGAKFHGDKHGEDTDKDGQEGIPLNAPGGYVASNHLGLDGRVAKKQKGGKTVAEEMTPLIDYLHRSEQDSQDAYKNNPVAIKQVIGQLEKMKNTAEVNKWRRELEKMIKNDEIPMEDVLNYIKENAPVEDLNPSEAQAMQGLMPQQSNPMQEQMAPEQMPVMQPTAKNGLNMNYNNKYRKFQMGGSNPGMPSPQDEQPAPNPSGDRMNQLMSQATQMTNQPAINPAMQDMSPEVQQMFSQLPPEVQDQIMQMPPEQMEIAIMNAYEQMNAGGGQGMQPEMGQEQMPPEEAAMMAEQQALMQLGGYTNDYFGDKYRDKNYAYPEGHNPQAANAHMPRPVLKENYNEATKTHTQPFAAFQDRYQTGGAISNDMVQLVQQLVQQGYSQEQAIEVAKNKLAQEGQPQMKSGGMIGKTVSFKVGGRIVTGKVTGIDNNGNFTLG